MARRNILILSITDDQLDAIRTIAEIQAGTSEDPKLAGLLERAVAALDAAVTITPTEIDGLGRAAQSLQEMAVGRRRDLARIADNATRGWAALNQHRGAR